MPGRLEEELAGALEAKADLERRAAELERQREEERERRETVEASAREQVRRTEELSRARDGDERRAEAAEAQAERHELRVRELEQRCVELEETLAAADAVPDRDGTPAAASRHLLFVQAGAGYELLEREGAPPERGDAVELDETRFVVVKLGCSPIARDRRPCAYLQAAA
jgi:hypothetical protein